MKNVHLAFLIILWRITLGSTFSFQLRPRLDLQHRRASLSVCNQHPVKDEEDRANLWTDEPLQKSAQLSAQHDQCGNQTLDGREKINGSSTSETSPSVIQDEQEAPQGIKLPFTRQIKRFLKKPTTEILEAFLVLISTVLVAVDTLDGLSPFVYKSISHVQDVLAYTFCLDFILRWYVNVKEGPKYFAKPLVLVDFIVVVLPILLPAFRAGHLLPAWCTSKGGLINLRLLRLLRLQRVLTDMETFSSFQEALGVRDPQQVQPYKLQLARVLLSLFTLLCVASGLIYTTEHTVNPGITDFFTALYFGLTTLTTVGFGDITPVTTGGKLVVMGSILAGVAVIPKQAAALVEALLDYEKQRELQKQGTRVRKSPSLENSNGGMMDVVTPCPVCGASMHWASASYCWSCGNKL
jgi:voltage-gated potassium channel